MIRKVFAELKKRNKAYVIYTPNLNNGSYTYSTDQHYLALFGGNSEAEKGNKEI